MREFDPHTVNQKFVEDTAVLRSLHEIGRIDPGHKMIIAMLWRIAKVLEKK